LVTPGNIDLLITRRGARFVCELKNRPLVNGHRPSVNVTFRSAAKVAGINTVGVLLTGMGSDRAEGLLEIKNAGGYTIVEGEETATVFGMPKVAIQLGAKCEILPLDQIPKRLVEVLGQQRPQPSPASKAQLVR
jgi:two-component system chemotaxis response regulator CheB